MPADQKVLVLEAWKEYNKKRKPSADAEETENKKQKKCDEQSAAANNDPNQV